MSLQFIIDAYNIIHHPIFRKHLPKKVQDSRLILLRLIKTNSLCGSPNNKIFLVFDGYPNAQDADNLRDNEPGFSIVFSRKESADERIKKIIEKCSSPKTAVVVSDDKEIREFVRAMGGKVRSVEEFIGPKKENNTGSQDSQRDIKPSLTYTEMHNINQELKKIWLK